MSKVFNDFLSQCVEAKSEVNLKLKRGDGPVRELSAIVRSFDQHWVRCVSQSVEDGPSVEYIFPVADIFGIRAETES